VKGIGNVSQLYHFRHVRRIVACDAHVKSERLGWRCAQKGLPFFERFRGIRIPRVLAIVVRPDDLVQRKMSFALVPECESHVVGVVAGVDLDVVALHADEEVHIA
jgi:hypothetical protein